MSEGLFNTAQETAARLTLCLSELPRPAALDEIAVIDFVATYMKRFGFGSSNLHGDGPHIPAEYEARRNRVRRGLARLVVIGYAAADRWGDTYTANHSCIEYADALRGNYAMSYRAAVTKLTAMKLTTLTSRIEESR